VPIVGGLDIHRKQITFGYMDTVTGEVKRGQGVQEQVAAAPVGVAGSHHVPFVLAAGDQVSQGELADDGEPESAAVLAVGSLSASQAGAVIQPRRSPGARVLAVVPTWATRSGSRPCTAPTAARSWRNSAS
jgi:hypothetical protein